MKKLLHIFLSFLIVYFTTYSAYANTSVGGWTLTDSLIAGANTTINATKTAGGIALESSAKVGASVAKVGAKLIKGGGYTALAYAMVELLDEGIDWVLDPANNAVRYTIPADVDNPAYANKVWCNGQSYNKASCFSTYPQSLNYMCEVTHGGGRTVDQSTVAPKNNGTGGWTAKCILPTGYQSASANTYPVTNPDYVGEAPDDEIKYMPIETVAAKVISNAEAGHGPSQDVVEAVALEGFAAGELDPALNAAANAVGAEAAAAEAADTTNPPDTADPANPPFDDSAILSALYSIKAVAVGILGTTNDFFDWGKQQWAEFALTFNALNDWVFEEDSPTDSDNTIDPTIPPVVPVQVAIDFVGGCPAPLTFDFNFYGQNYKPAIPFTPICEVAILINPIIHICATIAAAYIVAGIRQGGT